MPHTKSKASQVPLEGSLKKVSQVSQVGSLKVSDSVQHVRTTDGSKNPDVGIRADPILETRPQSPKAWVRRNPSDSIRRVQLRVNPEDEGHKCDMGKINKKTLHKY